MPGEINALADVLEDDDRASTPVTVIRIGTVKTIVVGGSTDGNDQVTVTVNGNDLLAPYLDSYLPELGHVVAVAFTNGSPLILARRIGTPTF